MIAKEKPRVLLLSPSFDEREAEQSGLLHLAAGLKGTAGKIRIMPCKATPEQIRQAVQDFKPHIVGISVHSSNEEIAVANAILAKMANGGRAQEPHVVFGGPGIITRKINARLLRHSAGTAAIAGEGENAFRTLAGIVGTTPPGKLAREQVAELRKIPGSTVYNRGRIYHPKKGTEKGEYLTEKELDALKLDYDLYGDDITGKVRLFSSRGCKGVCTFCSRPHGSEPRGKTPVRTVEEIEKLHKRLPEQQIIPFDDDTFLYDPKRAVRIANLILKRKKQGRLKEDLYFSIQTTMHSLMKDGGPDIKMMEKLHDAGVRGVDLGLENIDPDERKLMGKGKLATLDVANLLFKLAVSGMQVQPYLILSTRYTRPNQLINNLLFARHIEHLSLGRVEFQHKPNLIAVPGTLIERKLGRMRNSKAYYPAGKCLWPSSPDGRQKEAIYPETTRNVRPKDELTARIIGNLREQNGRLETQQVLEIAKTEIRKEIKELENARKGDRKKMRRLAELKVLIEHAEKSERTTDSMTEKMMSLAT